MQEKKVFDREKSAMKLYEKKVKEAAKELSCNHHFNMILDLIKICVMLLVYLKLFNPLLWT